MAGSGRATGNGGGVASRLTARRLDLVPTGTDGSLELAVPKAGSLAAPIGDGIGLEVSMNMLGLLSIDEQAASMKPATISVKKFPNIVLPHHPEYARSRHTLTRSLNCL